MVEAYSHEVSSAGYWLGQDGEGVLYSYAYPQLDGFSSVAIGTPQARFDESLGEFVLSYEVVHTNRDRDASLLAFLHTTCEAAADLASRDRAALERRSGTTTHEPG